MSMSIRLTIIAFGVMTTLAGISVYAGNIQQRKDSKIINSKQRQKNKNPIIDSSKLEYPYYEWITKDTAIAWVRKKTGHIVGVPLSIHSKMLHESIWSNRQENMGEGVTLLIKPNHNDIIIGGVRESLKGITRPIGMKLSPDGTKALYLLAPHGSQAEEWRAGSVNGERYSGGKLLPYAHSPELVWKRDSLGWVGLTGSNQSIVAVHYNIDGVSPPVETPIPELRPKQHSSNTNTWVPTILGIKQNGIAIVLDQQEPTDIYMLDVDKGYVLPGNHKISLPKKASVLEVRLSHSGDRIIWLLHIDTDQVSKGKLSHMSSVEIWLSKSDGSDMKKLSDFTPTNLPTTEVNGIHAPKIIKWTMDDSAISYIKERKLHIVKVL